MRPRILESLRQRPVRARGWLFPVALLAVAPKCFLCVLAYAGLGTVLGFSGPEICGASSGSESWVGLIPALGVVSSAIGYLAWGRCRRPV